MPNQLELHIFNKIKLLKKIIQIKIYGIFLNIRRFLLKNLKLREEREERKY
jgi:hypothetical protein